MLMIVLPTGSSKSILFMALAVIEGRGIGIVVVLFVVLIDDLVAQV